MAGNQLDLAMSAFRKDNRLKGFWIEPNLVQHLGMKTSMDDNGEHVNSRDDGDVREYLANFPI